MYVCMYVYIYIYIYIHMDTHICISLSLSIYIYIYNHIMIGRLRVPRGQKPHVADEEVELVHACRFFH